MNVDLAPPAADVFRWFCLSWLALVVIGLLLIVVGSWWRNRHHESIEFVETTEMPASHPLADDGLHPECMAHDLPAAHRLCINNPENSGPRAA